jgi:hypothetical protein
MHQLLMYASTATVCIKTHERVRMVRMCTQKSAYEMYVVYTVYVKFPTLLAAYYPTTTRMQGTHWTRQWRRTSSSFISRLWPDACRER